MKSNWKIQLLKLFIVTSIPERIKELLGKTAKLNFRLVSNNSEFGVDASLSKFIGGMLNLVYILAGLAVVGIIYSEISKSLKNGQKKQTNY